MCVSVHKGGLNRGPADCIETIPQPLDLLRKINCQVSFIQTVRNPRFDPTFPEKVVQLSSGRLSCRKSPQ